MVRRLTSALAVAVAIVVLAGVPVGAAAQSRDTSPSASDTPAASEPPARVGDSLGEAVSQDARRYLWPLLLGALVVGFLVVQSRSERHERKLADAPLDQGERLRFK